jgi:dTDP-glucose pyrophosphorylase
MRAPLVVITMAGHGRRFRAAGFDCPKWRIQSAGRSLFDWSIASLASYIAAGSPFVFITRAEEDAGDFVRCAAARAGIATIRVIALNADTDGQATTALLGVQAAGQPDRPVVIFNIDTHVRPGCLALPAPGADGWIPCFRAHEPKWSFVRTGPHGQALEVREKKPISDCATLGLYGFRSSALYEGLYARHFADAAGAERGERYIAPMYNTLIAEGGRIDVPLVPSDAVVPLGTPGDLALAETLSWLDG